MLDKLIEETELELSSKFKELESNAYYNSEKILNAFKEEMVNNGDFASTTGYGYNDIGRDKCERVFARFFKAESALVRVSLICGTQAISNVLFGILRPNDTCLSITGLPYDSLHEIVGIKENKSSLAAFNINFKYIDLIDNDFDYKKIEETLKNENIKMVHIQRSIGYSTRNSISIEKLEKVISFIKNINKDIIVFVDNCYCELCNKKEPIEVGADIIAGSLIKNLGAGISKTGAYIAGRKDLVELCAEHLTAPGIGSEVGPSLNQTSDFLKGLFFAPQVVTSALKVKLFTATLLKKLGYSLINEETNDIVIGIVFNDKDKLINYVKLIQNNSPVDSMAEPLPSKLPGYPSEVIMASGSFTDGSSIELSCDGTIKEPYVAYQQGSLSYEYGKIAIINAAKKIIDEK